MVILVPRYMHQSTFEIFCVDIVSYASFSVTETLFDALSEILWIVLLCSLDRVPDVLIVVVVHYLTSQDATVASHTGQSAQKVVEHSSRSSRKTVLFDTVHSDRSVSNSQVQ